MTTLVPSDDETRIRALYQRMLDSWQDAAAYAECFAPDAEYIIADGMLERGRQEIIDGHKFIFSTWARNSRLEGRIDRIRFLTPAVAILTAYGRIAYLDHRLSDENEPTIYTLTAQKADDDWIFVAYQNTPIGGR
ncbi:SgcJ/EcaC family oxidoreductase [Nocardia sp. alder85J]|uniref:SgcJ/EcaC family oxidoreductase n=1 Tax=Nocardia sp. alder85J TaxID=2862949 RepID=UPI001CD5AF46|nr:SgcJ/EcaC family oxidoreductase [Nocardia sp. alder85J]MCX4098016.1 SgcJ/EcaC family oxidoreductase [Nocardia sp. alder85J]